MDEVTLSGIDLEWLKAHQRQVTKEEVRKASELTKKQEGELNKSKNALNEAATKAEVCRGVWQEGQKQIEKDFGKKPYVAFSATEHQQEITRLQQDRRRWEEKKHELDRTERHLAQWQNENRDVSDEIRDWLKEKSDVELEIGRQDVSTIWKEMDPLTKEEWEFLNLRPRKAADRVRNERNSILNNLSKQKVSTRSVFETYLRQLEQTNNDRIKQFTRDVRVIMDNDRLYDYDFVETQFLRIFEALDQYQEKYKQTLAENERNQQHLINLCLRRAKTVYDSIMEMPKNSRVTIYDRKIQVIRMEWKAWDEQEGQEKMHRYLTQVLQDLQRWKQEGMDDDGINRRMEDMLRTRNLIDVLSRIEECRITVYKPRKESIARVQRPDYSPWDEVSRWSGGEEYSIYITMFMILISHIRQQTHGKQNVWKTILADNPFGKASSPHILETVFQVANSNQIQLICFTAHKEENILQRFSVVYSLQLRNAYGREVMRAEPVEAGFYRYETPSEEETQLGLTI